MTIEELNRSVVACKKLGASTTLISLNLLESLLCIRRNVLAVCGPDWPSHQWCTCLPCRTARELARQMEGRGDG